MVLTQHAILHNPSLFTPTLDGFTVSVHVVTNGTMAKDKLMTLEMPKIHATKPQAIANFDNQAVTIASLAELTNFSTQVLQQEEVTLGLTGKTKLHLGSLPVTNVDYNEETTFKGKILDQSCKQRSNKSRSQWIERFQCHRRTRQPSRQARSSKHPGLRLHPKPICDDHRHGKLHTLTILLDVSTNILRVMSLSTSQPPRLVS